MKNTFIMFVEELRPSVHNWPRAITVEWTNAAQTMNRVFRFLNETKMPLNEKIERLHHARISLQIYEMFNIKFTYSFNGFILLKRRKSDMLITFANLNLTRCRFRTEPIAEHWERWIIIMKQTFYTRIVCRLRATPMNDKWFWIFWSTLCYSEIQIESVKNIQF